MKGIQIIRPVWPTDAIIQASILDLYDPDRSQAISYRGQPRSWSEAQIAIRNSLASLKPKQGSGLAILTEIVSSPTLSEQLAGKTSALRRDFPNAPWFQYEPAHSNSSHEGARVAFGEAVERFITSPPRTSSFRWARTSWRTGQHICAIAVSS